MIYYIRLNNINRKKKYQLTTKIEKINGAMFSSKTATGLESEIFLNSIYKKFKYLKNSKFSFKPIAPIKLNRQKILFKYQRYPTIESILFRYLINRNQKKFIMTLEKYIAKIKENNITIKHLSKNFNKVFGKCNKKFQCIDTGCLDLNFDNIFFDTKKNNYYITDYEWTFTFPIPYKYIIFRSLVNFYKKYQSYRPNKLCELSSLFTRFEINQQDEEIFINFEYNFQKTVTVNNSFNTIDYNIFCLDHSNIKQDHTLKTVFDEIIKLRQNNINNNSLQQFLINETIGPEKEKIAFKNQIKKLQTDLNNIYSSKTYRLWQKYNAIKKSLIRR